MIAKSFFTKPPYKIKKPVRLIELFAGIGAQAKALEKLGIDFEHYRICEFDKYAVQSYNAVHGTNFKTSDITKIHAKDLEIVDTDKYEYMLTYSYPCVPADTLILTKQDNLLKYKTMGDIEIGDLVLTKSGEWHNVNKKFDNGVHPIYTMVTACGNGIKVTSNHSFLTKKSIDAKPEFKEVKDITPYDYLGIRIDDSTKFKPSEYDDFIDEVVNGTPERILAVTKELAYQLQYQLMCKSRRAVRVIESAPFEVDTKTSTTVFELDYVSEDKYFVDGNYIWFKFEDLYQCGMENVYNIEVDVDHSYVMMGCISKNCTDLSLAGKQAGMSKGSGTRSGLLWEVERLLDECVEYNGNLPQILVMENVPQVHSSKNIQDFNMWISKLKDLGYYSIWKDLNAKDFGVPQNRDRTFMISILCNDYGYTFPKPIELKYRLKDVLEKQVDEKFYLKDSVVEKLQVNIDEYSSTEHSNLNNKRNFDLFSEGQCIDDTVGYAPPDC